LRLVAVEEALRKCTASEDQSLFGLFRQDEGLLQILVAGSRGCNGLERIGRVCPNEQGGRALLLPVEGGELAVELETHLPAPQDIEGIEVCDVESALDSRRIELTSDVELANKQVLLIGAGSLGSTIGLLLAEAGVGGFTIIDHDRLDAANLSRHACDLLDLGREKAVAVADLLRRRCVSAEPVAEDILEMDDVGLLDHVRRSDLVVASTDSPAVQFVVNEISVEVGTQGVFAGAFERACGGEVLFTNPGEGPCLYCATGFRAGAQEGIEVRERRMAYQAADMDKLRAEPGLAVDLVYIGTIAAAYALAALDPSGSRSDLLAPDRRFALAHGGSQPRGPYAELFRSPLEVLQATVVREGPCPVCGYQQLGIGSRDGR
jgi:hypothetical protein